MVAGPEGFAVHGKTAEVQRDTRAAQALSAIACQSARGQTSTGVAAEGREKMITGDQLHAICPHAGPRILTFLQPLDDAMDKFGITTPRREAAFLAQCAHESGELLYTREIASGEAYEGRADLGNTQPGDGPRYKGGGLIEITGRYNYSRCGIAIGVDLEADPELIELPANACMASAWFWATHGLNELSDQNAFGTVTHKINGGYTGIDQRLEYWLVALKATGAL
jgi:putative chitinase